MKRVVRGEGRSTTPAQQRRRTTPMRGRRCPDEFLRESDSKLCSLNKEKNQDGLENGCKKG